MAKIDNAIKITKWGNSHGVRIPVAVLKQAGLGIDDLVYIESDRSGRIVINKKPGAKKGTLEYLFKDYTGERFETELVDLGEPVGEEKW